MEMRMIHRYANIRDSKFDSIYYYIYNITGFDKIKSSLSNTIFRVTIDNEKFFIFLEIN